MAAIIDFKISVPDSELELLRRKLELTRLPDELDGSGWDYGAPLADIKRLTQYWQNGYDWRKHEAKLNEIPQYVTDIDVEGFGALKVHFVHQRSNVEKAIPLLFSHGWPGSFLEAAKIVPILTQGGSDHPAFHVVAPSLPNYGFSQGVSKKGFSASQYAEVCHKLMLKLGYSKYVTQGGDWGTLITRTMGLKYPEAVMGSHINMVSCGPPSYDSPLLFLQYMTTPYTEREKEGLKRMEWVRREGRGYFKEQSTRPQTIGYSQADSPSGLLAWIYEKLHDWTDNYPWTDDEILTWISIYWFSTAGPAAASRIYYEVMHDKNYNFQTLSATYTKPKLGLATFPKDLAVTPKTWHKTLGDVVYESEWDEGGHFAAWEKPDAVVGDLRTMFGKGGGAYKVVPGKSGYSDAPARL